MTVCSLRDANAFIPNEPGLQQSEREREMQHKAASPENKPSLPSILSVYLPPPAPPSSHLPSARFISALSDAPVQWYV